MVKNNAISGLFYDFSGGGVEKGVKNAKKTEKIEINLHNIVAFRFFQCYH